MQSLHKSTLGMRITGGSLGGQCDGFVVVGGAHQ
jgi:hypothetical protein